MSNTATKTTKPATKVAVKPATTYVGPEARLGALCYDLAQLEERIAPLEAERQAIRAELSLLVDQLGTQEVEGFGRLEITAPALVVSYDRQKVERLMLALIDEGRSEIAERISAARKESARAGSLRITRDKD
jgi:uncharacterized small protein (DUF1192 family)